MKLSEVGDLLGATVCFGTRELLDAEVSTVAASDLMSDILARTHTPDVLLTRLNNKQIIHTASIFEIKAVVVVRNRPLDEGVIEAALEEGVVLLSTALSLFETCGTLYGAGLRSIG